MSEAAVEYFCKRFSLDMTEEQIRKFVSRDYWEVHASFLVEAGEYPGKWFNPDFKKDADDAEKKADRVWTEAEALAIVSAVRGNVVLASFVATGRLFWPSMVMVTVAVAKPPWPSLI